MKNTLESIYTQLHEKYKDKIHEYTDNSGRYDYYKVFLIPNMRVDVVYCDYGGLELGVDSYDIGQDGKIRLIETLYTPDEIEDKTIDEIAMMKVRSIDEIKP